VARDRRRDQNSLVGGSRMRGDRRLTLDIVRVRLWGCCRVHVIVATFVVKRRVPAKPLVATPDATLFE